MLEDEAVQDRIRQAADLLDPSMTKASRRLVVAKPTDLVQMIPMPEDIDPT